MIFTSNYARDGEDPNAVAISVRPPKWYKGKHYPLLAPTWKIVHEKQQGIINDEQYTELYFKILEMRKLNVVEVLEDIGENAILLCYEKSDDFCHRRLVADWIKRETGVDVPEKSLYNSDNELLKELFL